MGLEWVGGRGFRLDGRAGSEGLEDLERTFGPVGRAGRARGFRGVPEGEGEREEGGG